MKNRRTAALLLLIFAAAALCAIAAGGAVLGDRAVVSDFSRKNLPPCPALLFGADWLGRDMLARTLAGLSLSIRVGALTAAVSAAAALVLTLEDKWDRRLWKALGLYWLFLLSWLPITVGSFLKRTTVWEEIRHTRAMAPQGR